MHSLRHRPTLRPYKKQSAASSSRRGARPAGCGPVHNAVMSNHIPKEKYCDVVLSSVIPLSCFWRARARTPAVFAATLASPPSSAATGPEGPYPGMAHGCPSGPHARDHPEAASPRRAATRRRICVCCNLTPHTPPHAHPPPSPSKHTPARLPPHDQSIAASPLAWRLS